LKILFAILGGNFSLMRKGTLKEEKAEKGSVSKFLQGFLGIEIFFHFSKKKKINSA